MTPGISRNWDGTGVTPGISRIGGTGMTPGIGRNWGIGMTPGPWYW